MLEKLQEIPLTWEGTQEMIASFFPCFLAMLDDFVIQAAVQGQISSQPEIGKKDELIRNLLAKFENCSLDNGTLEYRPL